MRSDLTGWNSLLAKLGFSRTKRKGASYRKQLARRLRLEALEDRRMLSTVTTPIDVTNPNDGVTTLREAIVATPAGGIVDFAPSLNGATLELNSGLGQISFGKNLTIAVDPDLLPNGITIDAGDGADQTPFTFDGFRIFNITAPNPSSPPLVTLIGLTLQRSDVPGDGGAINSAARLVVRECVIQDNSAIGAGGGIFVQVAGGGPSREILRIENSFIEDNRAASGGGLAVDSSGVTSDTILITGTNISGNNTTAGGGSGAGIDAVLSGADLTIVDSTFNLNRAGLLGGGISAQLSSGSLLTIDQTNFEQNVAIAGGALFVAPSQASVEIMNSTLENNEAFSSGGGVYANLNNNSSVVITNSRIGSSTAPNVAAGFGGGMFGKFAPDADAQLTIVDSTISGNMGNDGGGIAVLMPDFAHTQANGSVFTVQRARVEGNHAAERGGGLLTATGSGGEITIEDSVISGNDAGASLPASSARIPNAGGGMYAYMFSNQTPASLTIARTEISNNTAGKNGGGLVICTKRQASTSAISRLGVYNSTISGNRAGHTTQMNYGGKGGGAHLAIFDGANDPEEALDARFQNVTITDNTADTGGGIFSLVTQARGETRNEVRLTNSIAWANRKHNGQASNLFGSFNITETVFNIIGTGNTTWNVDHMPQPLRNEQPPGSDPASGNNFIDNPMLGPLAWHGGFGKTHRLLTNSPAIDAGSNDKAIIPFSDIPPSTAIPLTTDQRGVGFVRPYDVPGVGTPGVATVDVGAYEISLAKVIDVVLDNPTWGRDPYSYAQIVPTGKQLAPIYTQGVSRIEIQFSEDVMMDGSDLVLWGSTQANGVLPPLPPAPVSINRTFSYEPATHVATWTFATPLPRDKYRIELSSEVTDAAAYMLDGEWENFTDGTPDNFADDGDEPEDFTGHPNRLFPSGNGVENGSFEFWFSLLAGDYNQDGVVVNTGPTSDLLTLADGNGDGVVNSADNAIVNANVNTSLPARNRLGEGTNRGDYHDDDIVGQLDYKVWKMTFGSITDLRADGSGDGEVNAVDYNFWRESLYDYSAWYRGTLPMTGGGGGVPIVQFGEAPRVANVVISSSLASESWQLPHSFDQHDGSGEQLRTVPVGGADTISITFSEDVNIVASDLQLVGLRTANRPALAEYSYDLGTMTATWRFTGWALGDQYAITLNDAVTDVEGNRLDGEWTNPASLFTTDPAVSEFPSGNGEAGGDFNFVATLLPGDANLDLIVDGADYAIWTVLIGADGVFQDGEFDGDGLITGADGALWYQYSGYNLQQLEMLSDLNGDWVVDDLDADVLFYNWSIHLQNPTQADGDLDVDGDIDINDLDLVFAQWGLTLNVVS